MFVLHAFVLEKWKEHSIDYIECRGSSVGVALFILQESSHYAILRAARLSAAAFLFTTE